ncbi:hypothetical protein CgunFtcFv8_002714 [Champsocephalus gunnari]|uniref:Uncharacterized protein n=1 Tax=Champsocephalus gunnari TaxID=52237 RepID=A0AAN8HMX7_CHAGU|nr:hypothetical protein CgunFtcFv8_002714 [Champsocephalus gunnari]
MPNSSSASVALKGSSPFSAKDCGMLGVLEERVEASEFLCSCFTEEESRERRVIGCLLGSRSDLDVCLREMCPDALP